MATVKKAIKNLKPCRCPNFHPFVSLSCEKVNKFSSAQLSWQDAAGACRQAAAAFTDEYKCTSTGGMSSRYKCHFIPSSLAQLAVFMSRL